ncbi:MAG: Conjugative transposon protein TcpC, partial [Bacillota bacterium]|nr:Conjugative transposon protein TcpC [Bacillota bacterium]
GRFAVDASPIFVPQEDAADVEGTEAYNGLEVSQQEKAELSQVLESFLKTYYGGSDQEVSYYVSEDSSIKHGLKADFTFTSLKRMTAYTEDTGKYLVNAVVSVNDNGQEIEQNMYIYLSKAGDKIYIEQITTRVR